MTAASRLAQRLVQATLELHARKLWLLLEEDDAVMLDVPGHDSPLAACICGQAGREFGLVLFRDGLLGCSRFFSGDAPEDVAESVDQLILLVSPLREVPPPLRGLLEEARWRGRRDSPAPHLLVKRPGTTTRGPRKGEIRTMLYAVSAILAAHDAGDLDARSYAAPEGVQRLRLSGPPHAPDYEIDRAVFEDPGEGNAGEPLALAPRDYRVRDGAWRAGLLPLDVAISGDRRTTSVLLVVDGGTGQVSHHDLVMGHAMNRAASSFLRFVAEDGILPREVLFLNRQLAEILRPALSARGVSCRHEPDQPLLRELAERLSASFARGDVAGGDPDRAAAEESGGRQEEFIAALTEVGRRHRPNRDRALARYFGSARRGHELLAAGGDELLFPFMVWQLLFYRAQSNSKTTLERTLERSDLAPEARAVGEAMRDAAPSLYRVESRDPPFVTMRDLVRGQTVRVRDASLARTAPEGIVLPAISFPADGFLTFSMIGPSLAPMHVGGAFDLLESQGIPVTPEGLAANPHFGGRLAEWSRRLPVGPPQLCNSQGDAMLLHTGDFSADDPRAAAAALGAHPDLDYDERAGRFAWLGGDMPGGGRVVLGWIDVMDDHLVLECNSAERFATGRDMLESVPGVRLAGLRTQAMDLDALRDGVPRDDLPGIDEHGTGGALDQHNLPPEIATALVDIFAQHQMQWLDSEIPAFGGKTPRQLCKTADGRRRVRFEIQSMPVPHPSLAGEPIDRIRATMLHELGLEPEDA